jgi:WD40 repeat protein
MKALAYSPDGRTLACTGENSRIIDLRDARTFARTARLAGQTGAVYFAAFDRDGRRLLSTGEDRSVHVWEVAAGVILAVLRGHADHVFAAEPPLGVTRLAWAGRDRAILLWDVATGAEVARVHGHTNYVFSLAFSPDGTALASCSGVCTVRLWDSVPQAGRLEGRPEDPGAVQPLRRAPD